MKTYLFFFVLVSPFIILQLFADQYFQRQSLIVALINFVIIKNLHYMALTYFLVKFVSFLTGEELDIMPRRKKDHWMRWGVMGCASIFFAIEGYVNLEIPLTNKPLIISHRGVSNQNGVQNTLQSLEETVQLKPDLVEIDIQETKDGQFVMMHDPNLKTLAGVKSRPQELTLAELTNLTISENGFQTKISSFDDYLARANALNQRLLIEIKTSRWDSADMMQRFLKQYSSTIKQYNHQIQSLDYKVIDQVVQYDSSIPVYFILPYNTIFPRTNATGYTMEYSTLDENFVTKLWTTEKKLYDWTINSDDAIMKSLNLGVDGMITDDVELVQQTVNDSQDNPSYTIRLLDQSFELFNFSN